MYIKLKIYYNCSKEKKVMILADQTIIRICLLQSCYIPNLGLLSKHHTSFKHRKLIKCNNIVYSYLIFIC